MNMKIVRVYYRKKREERLAISQLDIQPELLQLYHDIGIIEINEGCIPVSQLRRLHKAIRLNTALGVNLSGAAIILDLLDKLEKLQAENALLRRRGESEWS